jgi:hypothetical protein
LLDRKSRILKRKEVVPAMEDPRIRTFARFLIRSAVGLEAVRKSSSSSTVVRRA